MRLGRLNQAEYSYIVEPILASEAGEKEHYHNQLFAAIYGNVTREMPDQGLAPWVSANDKPTTTQAPKPPSGDATERKLKGEVMQLPSRDRRRIKDLIQNEVCRKLRVSLPGRELTCFPWSSLTHIRPLRACSRITKGREPPGPLMCRLVPPVASIG